MVLLYFSFSTCRQLRTGMEDHRSLLEILHSKRQSDLVNGQQCSVPINLKGDQSCPAFCRKFKIYGQVDSHLTIKRVVLQKTPLMSLSMLCNFSAYAHKELKKKQLLTIWYYNSMFFRNMYFSHPATIILTFRGRGKTSPIPTFLPLNQTNKAFSSSEFKFLLELIQQPERIARSQGPASFNTPPSFWLPAFVLLW